MEVKKGYKQTEVGVIPEDWEVKELGEITSLMTNGYVGIVKAYYAEHDNGVIYIQGYNVEENSFNFHGIKKVTEEFHKKQSKSCLREGDLLTVQTGDIGLTTVVPRELEGSNCHALIITRFKKQYANSYFFSFYLNSYMGRRRLKEIETGTTMKHINVGDMIYFIVPIPALAEQTAIATALADIDELIQSMEKFIAKKRIIKKGAMQELLKPKDGWMEKKLGEVLKLQGGYAFGSTEFQESGIPIIRISNINNNNVDLGEVVYSKEFNIHEGFVIKYGDVLVAMSGATTGKIGVYRYDFCSYQNQRVGKFVIKDGIKNYLPFVSHLVRSENFKIMLQKMIAQGAQPNISGKQIELIELSFPNSINEQTRIATILSDMDAEITALEAKLAKYKQIKQGMMQTLLTGRIRLI